MGISIGCLAAIIVAGLLGSVRAEVDPANAVLALVLVVVVAAYTGGRWAGGATGIVAAISYDFFLTAPYRSLAIKDGGDVLTTALLLGVGLAVGTIATSRHKAKAAGDAGTAEVAGLYRVAGLAADGAAAEEVVSAVEHEVAAVLRLRRCRFESLPLDPPLAELDHGGRVDAAYRFEGDGFALPAEGVTIAVRAGGRIAGWLVCLPADPTVGIARDRRRAALVLADHLGLALALDATRNP